MKLNGPSVAAKFENPSLAAALLKLQQLNQRDAQLALEEERLASRVSAQNARVESGTSEDRAAAELAAGRAIADGAVIATVPVEARLAATREARRLLRLPIFEAHAALETLEGELLAAEIRRLLPGMRVAHRELQDALTLVQTKRTALLAFPAALRAGGYRVFDLDLFRGLES